MKIQKKKKWKYTISVKPFYSTLFRRAAKTPTFYWNSLRPCDPQGRGLDQSGGETSSDHSGKHQQLRRRGDRKAQLPETQQGGQGHVHHCLVSHRERVGPVIGWSVRTQRRCVGVWIGLFFFFLSHHLSASPSKLTRRSISAQKTVEQRLDMKLCGGTLKLQKDQKMLKNVLPSGWKRLALGCPLPCCECVSARPLKGSVFTKATPINHSALRDLQDFHHSVTVALRL